VSALEGDFRASIWAPAHGLLHGLNPFVANHLYETRYRTPAAALYTPDTYLVMAPASFVPFTAGAILFFLAMLGFTWGTVLVVIRPWTTDRLIAGAFFGAVVLYSLPSEYSLSFGQPTALLAFGVALTTRAAIRRDTSWVAVIGLTIALLKVQTGLPVVLLLLAMSMYKVVVRAIALTLVLSLPGLIAEVRAAHGVSEVITTWRTNLRFLNTLNSTVNLRLRVDLAGTAFRLSHYDITVLSLLFGIALSVFAVIVVRRFAAGLWMWPFISTFLTLVLYHQQYDVHVPLLCFLPIVLEFEYHREVWLACAGLLLVDLVCRPGFATHWVSLLETTPGTFFGGISTLTTFVLLVLTVLITARLLVAQRRGPATPVLSGQGAPISAPPAR